MSVELDDEARAAVIINEHDLTGEYIRLPALMARYGARLSLAIQDYQEAELAFDRVEAGVSLEWRHTLGIAREGTARGGKATESSVQDHVRNDQRWVDAKMGMIEADAKRHRARELCTALAAKREMLVSLGAHIRKEMDLDPTTRRTVANHNAVKGRSWGSSAEQPGTDWGADALQDGDPESPRQ
jgi:hypothetical protein